MTTIAHPPEGPDVLPLLCLAGLLALLLTAALSDVRERRIPNWLSGAAAALYPLYVIASPVPVAWSGGIAVAALVLLLGVALFARGLVGGGDVKLLAAVGLWAGAELWATFFLVTTLAGGVLGLGALWYRRWRELILAHLAALGLAPGGGRPAPLPAAPSSRGGPAGAPADVHATTLPYGVAIAAGGMAVIIDLMKL